MDFAVFQEVMDDERGQILLYLEPDLGNCLYMYMDIEAYEIGGDVISVWVQRGDDDSIIAIAMRYSDSFQLYARESDYQLIDYVSLASLLKALDPMRISGPVEMINRLASSLGADYELSVGSVLEIKKYRNLKPDGIEVEKATREDIPEIAALIKSDEELGRAYSVEALIDQFESRYDTGTGVSYIIRVDGVIVAHLCFSAITDKFVIEAYTLVHPAYRDYPYGAILTAYVTNVVVPQLGVRGFGFMQDQRKVRLFELMGNPVVGEYGKLLKN